MDFVILLLFSYFVNKTMFYYQIKYYCKKYNADCNKCNNFLCPRFKILHKEVDKIFLDNLKLKIKNFFHSS